MHHDCVHIEGVWDSVCIGLCVRLHVFRSKSARLCSLHKLQSATRHSVSTSSINIPHSKVGNVHHRWCGLLKQVDGLLLIRCQAVFCLYISYGRTKKQGGCQGNGTEPTCNGVQELQSWTCVTWGGGWWCTCASTVHLCKWWCFRGVWMMMVVMRGHACYCATPRGIACDRGAACSLCSVGSLQPSFVQDTAYIPRAAPNNC